MIQNPFITSGEIPEPYFCDRDAETKKLISMLTTGSNVCLVAPRRIGKSKLIKHLFAQPEMEKFYTIYIDLFHTSSLRELVQTFGTAVVSVLQTKGEKTLAKILSGLRSIGFKLSSDPITGVPTLGVELGDIQSPELSVNEIFDMLEKADKPCIVAFDEFQQIVNYPEKNVEALLRGRIQHLANCNFIFCGSQRHLIAEMFMSSKRPFYASTEMMGLKPSPQDTYTEFVKRMLDQFGKTLQDGTVEYVYGLAQGNTAFMQRIFHFAFNRIGKGEECTQTVVKLAFADMLDSAEDVYQPLLSRLPEHQKMLLYAIAKVGRAQKIMSGSFIRANSLKSSSSVQAALKKLLEMDLLSVENGEYFVTDMLLQYYLQRTLGIPME